MPAAWSRAIRGRVLEVAWTPEAAAILGRGRSPASGALRWAGRVAFVVLLGLAVVQVSRAASRASDGAPGGVAPRVRPTAVVDDPTLSIFPGSDGLDGVEIWEARPPR
jgi:hypothetical protein